MQHLTASMQIHHGLNGNGMLAVGRIRQSGQNACIDKVSHYS